MTERKSERRGSRPSSFSGVVNFENPILFARPFADEFFKTNLNLPPGCKRWIISFMGRAHPPSAIRHRPVTCVPLTIRRRYHNRTNCIYAAWTRNLPSTVTSHRFWSIVVHVVVVAVAVNIRRYFGGRRIVSRYWMPQIKCTGEDKNENKKTEKEEMEEEERRVNGERTNGVDEAVARSKWREKIAGEKRAGSQPGAGLLSLTEVPNTCGITGAGQVHRWRRKTKVFSTREPQDGILLGTADETLAWKIFYCTPCYPPLTLSRHLCLR